MSDLDFKAMRALRGRCPSAHRGEAQGLLKQLKAGWSINAASTEIRREYAFKDFYRTMSFVNAVAHIANREDHHPDLEVGYNYCRIRYSTHAIEGLSENDFICAAKIDTLQT